MKKPIISCILFCLILLPIQGQEINTAKIDSFLNHIEKYNQGIGSVAISKGEKTVYTRRFGQNNLNKKQNGEAFKYRIGSITKLMTATLLTSSTRTPKFISEQWSDALMAFHEHGSVDNLLVLRQFNLYCYDGLC